MPDKYYIIPANLEDGGGEVDNSLPGRERPVDPSYGRPDVAPGRPTNPIVLPSLPGIWPPPGQPSLPVVLPPRIENPIYIPGSPEKPIALPPGIYPPLPPSQGIEGKVAILVWVVGVGYRWVVYEVPPVAQPK